MDKTIPEKKADDKPRLWWVFDCEELVVAVVVAVTNGGALAKYEAASGRSREGVRAARLILTRGCALTGLIR